MYPAKRYVKEIENSVEQLDKFVDECCKDYRKITTVAHTKTNVTVKENKDKIIVTVIVEAQ